VSEQLEIPFGLGLCQCGCGQTTKLAIDTNLREGRTKGVPLRYVKGHNARGQRASAETRAKLSAVARSRGPVSDVTRERQRASALQRDNSNLRAALARVPADVKRNRHWKGGRRLSGDGYVMIRVVGAYKFEHVLVAERALGHALPPGAVIHHHNEDKTDNRGANLVICPDDAYHVELHRKMRVLRAGSNPWTDRMCCICKQPRPTALFYKVSAGRGYGTVCHPCEPVRRAR